MDNHPYIVIVTPDTLITPHEKLSFCGYNIESASLYKALPLSRRIPTTCFQSAMTFTYGWWLPSPQQLYNIIWTVNRSVVELPPLQQWPDCHETTAIYSQHRQFTSISTQPIKSQRPIVWSCSHLHVIGCTSLHPTLWSFQPLQSLHTQIGVWKSPSASPRSL